MIIIGITGTLGAGKGTVVDYLVSKFHFEHFSVRKYLTSILIEQGIEPNRDQFTLLANRLRSENHSPSFLVEELFKEANKSGKNAIIESIRTVGEIQKLKALGHFYLLAVDADRHVRYERIVQRKSVTDQIDYHTFIADEEREMTATNPHHQNIGACIAQADYTILNDGDLESLHDQIDIFMNSIQIATL